MDKYEYKLKLEQIRHLMDAGEYKVAAEIADGINWKKVKSVTTLCMIGELYEAIGQLEDSREILLDAYDRSPVGRNIIYRLTKVALKLNSLEEAQEYYEEFLEIAPHDNMKYVLKYEIAKAKGAALPELILILEEFKEREYTEEWAYELAYLYHKSGNADKCVEICDELILWFGEGKYVEKALELKMLYEPLNKLQEEKYRSFKQKKPENAIAVDIQEELARSMEQIVSATKHETVRDTIKNMKRMAVENGMQQENLTAGDGEHVPVEGETIPSASYQGILAEEYDGQISLQIPDAPRQEPQVRGQMKIEDILAEWEKTKEAARLAIEEAEQRRLEDEKAKALKEAEALMEQLAQMELTAEETEHVYRELAEDNAVSQLSRQEEREEKRLTPDEKELDTAADGMKMAAGIGAYVTENMDRMNADGRTAGVPGAGAEEQTEERMVAEAGEQTEGMTPEGMSSAETSEQPEGMSGTETGEQTEGTMTPEAGGQTGEETETGSARAAKEAAFSLEQEIMRRQQQEQRILEEKIRKEHMLTQEVSLERTAQDELPQTELDEEQKDIFSYFTLISGMESQLCQALEGVKQRKRNNRTSAAGNLIVVGGEGSGKTALATDFVKAYQRISGCEGGKVGKISASVLNRKDMNPLFEAVDGGCLIIERAGDLSRESVEKLSALMEQDTKGMMVILEDDKAGIAKVTARNADFTRKFTERIHIPIFTSDELVAFAKAYAREHGCEIDDVGVLALYNSISNIQKLDEATTLTEVKEIMDDAIYNATHGALRRLFGRRRTNENGLVLIKEKDFDD